MTTGDARIRAPLEWLFQSRKTGSITVGQVPNLPMWIFLVTLLVHWTVSTDTVLADRLEGISLVSLAWWAILELGWGVNPWRKLLGVGELAFVTAGVATHT